jgi:hypothetical protein
LVHRGCITAVARTFCPAVIMVDPRYASILDRVGAQEARQVAAVRLPMLSVGAGRIGLRADGAARTWSTSSCRSLQEAIPGVELGADHRDRPQAFLGRVVNDG